MALHTPLFGEPEVDALFSDDARLQTLLDVEVALAEALAAAGLTSPGTVDAIRQAAGIELLDRAALAHEAARAGNLVIPLVRQLTRLTAAVDPAASRWVHHGATSQDVLDTALALQVRAAVPVLLRLAGRAAAAAARHARTHRDTPLAGRTWLQQATPVTFGFKAAGWLEAIERGRRQLETAAAAAGVLQFGGASGTLAALGPAAAAVSQALAARLGLLLPDMPWHAQRDRLASLACAIGVFTGTLGKVARDLALLSQTEVAEAFEAPQEGRGGSSSMPHKRNPVAAAVALAAAVRAPGLVATMLAGMPQEHERGIGGWHAEWEVVPELFRLAAGAARSIADALETLVVDPARMAANLEISKGRVYAEAVAVALAAHLGWPEAYAVVEAACRRSADEDRFLADVLLDEPAVAGVMDRDALLRCFDPGGFLGQAGAAVDRVLSAWERGRPAGPAHGDG